MNPTTLELGGSTLIGASRSGACLNEDRTHRFTLWRRFHLPIEDTPPVRRLCAFVGLNPSTADEKEDDPTIVRCCRFCERWGFDGYVMLNLFSYRATDPKDMKADPQPNHPHNDAVIIQVCQSVGRVVVAWGNHGSFKSRDEEVADMLKSLCRERVYCLDRNANGSPKHPLYVKADQQVVG